MNKLVSGLVSVSFVLTEIFLSPAARCSDFDNRIEISKRQSPEVALALGGGGVRGAAHIGVLKVFREEGIPVDYVVGNSMGSFVGGLYCAGVPLEKIQQILSDGTLVSAYLPRFLWCRVLARPFIGILSMGRKRNYAGLVTGDKLKAIIDKLLPNSDMRVEDLKTPFSCIAVNLIDGQAHLLSKGRMDDIVRASATLPLLLVPVSIDNDLYVDGAVRNNLPTTEARHSGAKLVISVDIDNNIKPIPAAEFRSFRTVFDRVLNLNLEQLDEDNLHGADIVIRPQLIDVPILSKNRKYVDEAVKQGEMAARRALPAIRARLNEAGITTVVKSPLRTDQTIAEPIEPKKVKAF
jgi:NTE family protein